MTNKLELMQHIFVKVWFVINMYPMYSLTMEALKQWEVGSGGKIMLILLPYALFVIAPYAIIKAKDAATVINAVRCGRK